MREIFILVLCVPAREGGLLLTGHGFKILGELSWDPFPCSTPFSCEKVGKKNEEEKQRQTIISHQNHRRNQ